MSEKEIINTCESLWFDGEFFGIYYKKDEVDSLAEKAIQSLLDLYNKQKEAINKLIRYIAIIEHKDYEDVAKEFEI